MAANWPDERMKQIFRKFDVNHDGFITIEEWTNVLQMLDAKYWSLPRVRRIADALDRNHDGVIVYDELTKYIFNNVASGDVFRGQKAKVVGDLRHAALSLEAWDQKHSGGKGMYVVTRDGVNFQASSNPDDKSNIGSLGRGDVIYVTNTQLLRGRLRGHMTNPSGWLTLKNEKTGYLAAVRQVFHENQRVICRMQADEDWHIGTVVTVEGREVQVRCDDDPDDSWVGKVWRQVRALDPDQVERENASVELAICAPDGEALLTLSLTERTRVNEVQEALEGALGVCIMKQRVFHEGIELAGLEDAHKYTMLSNLKGGGDAFCGRRQLTFTFFEDEERVRRRSDAEAAARASHNEREQMEAAEREQRDFERIIQERRTQGLPCTPAEIPGTWQQLNGFTRNYRWDGKAGIFFCEVLQSSSPGRMAYNEWFANKLVPAAGISYQIYGGRLVPIDDKPDWVRLEEGIHSFFEIPGSSEICDKRMWEAESCNLVWSPHDHTHWQIHYDCDLDKFFLKDGTLSTHWQPWDPKSDYLRLDGRSRVLFLEKFNKEMKLRLSCSDPSDEDHVLWKLREMPIPSLNVLLKGVALMNGGELNVELIHGETVRDLRGRIANALPTCSGPHTVQIGAESQVIEDSKAWGFEKLDTKVIIGGNVTAMVLLRQ
eukprot:TRINITY_DN107649_c0_g1_i1.p1 TRINITY_DN107649_c0_g1~~TRINITY_DN107649_c0_g1_i1.p1  ORF type:complete len:658 (-),score=96.39 TRINITY_DN107649_c0_g1_i1:51-2024(-)